MPNMVRDHLDPNSSVYYVDPTSHVAYYGHMFLRVKVLDCDIVAFWRIYGYLILSK